MYREILVQMYEKLENIPTYWSKSGLSSIGLLRDARNDDAQNRPARSTQKKEIVNIDEIFLLLKNFMYICDSNLNS
jgi:hypothetical protein